MISGSHNSFSYAKPLRWWQYLGRFIGKCQNKTVRSQYKHGIRCFDIRIKFDEFGKPYTSHGLIDYKVDVNEEINWLLTRTNPNNHIYFRLTLETEKANVYQESNFILFCQRLEKNKYITCFNGTRKFDWAQIYQFDYKPTVLQPVGSMCSKYGKIWPWLWYKINKNKVLNKIVELQDSNIIVLQDFI